MNAIAKIYPSAQADITPDVRKDAAILAALEALVRAQNAYKSGCHHAANLHIAFAAQKLIAGSMPEAA